MAEVNFLGIYPTFNPSDSIIDPRWQPVGFTLEELVYLYWKPKKFKILNIEGDVKRSFVSYGYTPPASERDLLLNPLIAGGGIDTGVSNASFQIRFDNLSFVDGLYYPYFDIYINYVPEGSELGAFHSYDGTDLAEEYTDYVKGSVDFFGLKSIPLYQGFSGGGTLSATLEATEEWQFLPE